MEREREADAAEKDGNLRDFGAEHDRLLRRRRARVLRRIGIPVVVLAALLAYLSGLFGTSVAAAGDLVDSVRIALTPAAGYPVQTGITDIYQLEEMNGGFVELGAESCVVYAAGGNRLRAVQPGYARPAIAVGRHRFVIYNRSGTELRVESRSQTLYTREFTGSILTCAMAPTGVLAVVTEDSGHAARLTVYSVLMEEILSWKVTDSVGTPLRLAFSSDGRRLAVATLTASGGQLVSNLYVLDTRAGTETLVASAADGVPMALSWTGGGQILAVYDDHTALYKVSAGETARYAYAGRTLLDYSTASSGSVALLFENGTSADLTLLNAALAPTASQNVGTADGVTLTRTAAYVLAGNAVACYSTAGEHQWTATQELKPLAVLDTKQLLLFSGNGAAVLAAPAAPAAG